jgi:hypothetical protein
VAPDIQAVRTQLTDIDLAMESVLAGFGITLTALDTGNNKRIERLRRIGEQTVTNQPLECFRDGIRLGFTAFEQEKMLACVGAQTSK